MSGDPTHQIVFDHKGKPLFYVVPANDYAWHYNESRLRLDPWVTEKPLKDDGITRTRKWREFKGFTQKQMASKLGISQPNYAVHESNANLSHNMKRRIAKAMGIRPDQLD